ncbi:GNAT family N-acetyltransferase [Gemmobacter nectariphilus]|uniref:GNAT family N-acetyltransferase n=1 Tax=Gemmobacter nectariphilus TaxID=220343 RepID=UPI0004120BD8|nr:GNAT family N-acetyltransferase [Gemmobacter nectariphilus]
MIRPARPEDAAQILKFWNPLIRDTLVTFNPVEKTEAELRETIAAKPLAGHAFLVAEEDGQILGFASYGQFRAGPGYARAMEHTIILATAAHGRGIGRALMTAIEDDARAKGYHTMVAGVSGGNPQGRAFHAAIGYAEVGVIPESGWKFGRYWDLVLMQKVLA